MLKQPNDLTAPMRVSVYLPLLVSGSSVKHYIKFWNKIIFWWKFGGGRPPPTPLLYCLIWSIKCQICHRKYGASSDSAQPKINFKFSPLCANTRSQIFSPLMVAHTISDLLKVKWVRTTHQIVWRDVSLFGARQSINLVILCLILAQW